MKKSSFNHIKSKAKFSLTRDSVCFADDLDAPHKKLVLMPSSLNTKQLISNIYSEYLPVIDGDNHSWDCILNGALTAKITKTTIEVLKDQISYCSSNTIHFKYNSSIN